jgi:hypothetical protein
MRTAQLFAGFGAILLLIAGLARAGLLHEAPFGMGFREINFGGAFLQMFAGAICVAVALSYLGTLRTASHAPNERVGIASFILVLVSVLPFLGLSFFGTGASFENVGFMVVLFTALSFFFIGVILSAINLAWAVLR